MINAERNHWRWTRLLPLLLWIGLILWVASRPKTTFFPSDVRTVLGLPREWLQYPYHFGVFFILAIFFRRCFSGTSGYFTGWESTLFCILGCAAVSLCSEWIQFYVPTRTPAVRDLVLDQSAAMLAIGLMRNFLR